MSDNGPWRAKQPGGVPGAQPPRRPPSRTAIAVIASVVASGIAGLAGIAGFFSRDPPKGDDQRRFEADYRTCIRSESAETQRAACTRLIESGWLTKRDLAQVYNNRGVAHWRLDRFDLALADYERSLAINPDDPETYVNKGNAHVFREEHMAALASYGQAVIIDPKHPLAHRNMGNALLEIKEFPAALKSYELAIAATPNESAPYYLRGHLLMEMKRYREAVADFDAILRLDSRDARALAYRAVCWEQLGDAARSHADREAARVIDPGIAEKARQRALKL